MAAPSATACCARSSPPPGAVDASKTARLVVLAAASGSTKEANAYGQALKKAGWTGQVTTVVHGTRAWSASAVSGATAVVVVGDTPPALAQAMADPGVPQRRVDRRAPHPGGPHRRRHLRRPRLALVGQGPPHRGRPSRTRAVAAYRADDAQWLPGLGLVRGTVVPHLTDDFRWGRLQAGVTTAHRELALGVAADSALVLAPAGARVAGASVVVADGRQATTWTSANGALGASGVVLDVFGSGEAVAR